MESIKRCFFEQTLRRWRFQDLVEESGLSRERVNHFLRRLFRDGFIRRVKPRGKMPYYLARCETQSFRMEKRLFGLNSLAESGLFDHLSSCGGIKTAILFGSFSRGDWGPSSDVDLFIFGDDAGFDKGFFERKLERTIQVFSFESGARVRAELESSLIPNLIKGFNIKGTTEPFEVSVHA